MKKNKNAKTKTQIVEPSLSNLSNDSSEFEWHFIEKKSGTVIKKIEQTTNFELFEGCSLQIIASELEDWKKEIPNVKKLSNEKIETLKMLLSKMNSERPLTRKEIATIIEEFTKAKRTPKYRQSGHLIDEKLKYKPAQLDLFNSISQETKRKIEESTIEVKAEGIRLTPPENKLIHALNRILHEKSQNRNPESNDFYIGNEGHKLVPYGANNHEKAAVLRFRPGELYKAYIGHEEYSGHDAKFIQDTLFQLESKKVLIKYDRVRKIALDDKTIETRTDRIEDFQSLVKIISFIPDLTDEEKRKLDSGDESIREKKGEFVICLNPIFTDQIETKFIEFPVDTNRRLVIAAGGHSKVTSSMNTLMEWVLRDISNKRYKSEINDDKLPHILGLTKYVQQNRKKLLNDRISKDIQAMINMGIILSYEKLPNSIGGEKWVFHLNKDYE